MVKSIKKGLAIALAAVMVFSISPFVGKSETVKAEEIEIADVDCSDGWWASHSKGIKLEDGKTVTINFTNTTVDSADDAWCTAVYDLYYANADFAGGTVITDAATKPDGYAEVFVGRADNYGWIGNANTGGTLPTGYKYAKYSDVPETFLADNKEGRSVSIKATLVGTTVIVIMTLDGATNCLEYDNVDTSKSLYLSLTGQSTVLSGINYSVSAVELSQLNSTECVGFWTNHTRGIKLEKGTTTSIKFVNTSYDEAEGAWHSVLYDLYYATTDFAGEASIINEAVKPAGYTEIFVNRTDNYGWIGDLNTNDNMTALNEAGYTYTSIGTANLVDLKAGAAGTITASLDEAGTKVTVTMSIAGATNTLTYTGVDSSKGSVYLALTGERCRLSDFSYSCYYSDISDYRDETKTAPDSIYGTKFAGWFSDAECTTPIEDDATGAYAKFVDSNLLNLRYQLRAETDTNSESTSVRIMLGVDSLNYKNVGFAGTFNGKDLGKLESKKVCKSIDITEQDVTALEAPSKYFGNSAEYMLPYALLNIKKANFDKDLVVKPYWTTLDGTVVYGKEKTIKVEDCL